MSEVLEADKEWEEKKLRKRRYEAGKSKDGAKRRNSEIVQNKTAGRNYSSNMIKSRPQ
ncbi:MAG: hypothetical protein ACLRP8_10550 [Roseburia intestinalis]